MKIEEEVRKREKGPTLAEIIEKELKKVKKKEVVSHMGDTFFKQVEEGGNMYYLRRTNLLRDTGRTLNIVDEIEIQEIQEQKEREEEEKRDISFDDFMTKFLDHIEGNAGLDGRSVHESVEGEDLDMQAKSVRKGTASKKGTEMNKTASQMGDPEEDERKSVVSGGVKSNAMSKSRTDMNVSMENFKFEIPESCHVGIMSKCLIEKLDGKYLLVANPYPQTEGQMMIFLPKKADQREKEILLYRDYSLRKRLETTIKAPDSKVEKLIQKKKEKPDKPEKSANEPKLQCLEIDITNPLADIEWRNFIEVIDEVSGLGWFQILPVGQKSSQPFQFNMLHVLPGNKLPVD